MFCNYIIRKRKYEEIERNKSIEVLKILLSYQKGRLAKSEIKDQFFPELEIIKFIDDFLIKEIAENRFYENGLRYIHGWVVKSIPELYSYYKEMGYDSLGWNELTFGCLEDETEDKRIY